MLRIPKYNAQQVESILKVIKQKSSGQTPSKDSIKRLADVIHNIWELRNIKNVFDSIPKSAMLRKNKTIKGVVDHPFPQEQLAKLFLTMPKEDYRVPYLSNMLCQFAFFCLITPEEKNNLVKARINNRMPKTWNEIDRYARYAEVGIIMGEDELFNKEDFHKLLINSVTKFYVYRLWTPTEKVFYIGKGEKLRALSHEKEIFKRSFRTHTNWKKLNKIAQIIYSGKSIAYEIESWHCDETQAFLREDELILMAERENPWTLCNSNGSRWKGKPNRQLQALRAGRGLA